MSVTLRHSGRFRGCDDELKARHDGHVPVDAAQRDIVVALKLVERHLPVLGLDGLEAHFDKDVAHDLPHDA